MRYLVCTLGFTLALVVLMSMAPAMANSHKDGDSFKPPTRMEPQQPAHEQPAAPAAPEVRHETPPVPEAAPPAAPEPQPCERTWVQRRMDYVRHMDTRMMDQDALRFMTGACVVAILPFVDQTTPTSQGQSKLEMAGGPRRIVETLAETLMNKGYLVIPPMDAESALMQYRTNPMMQGPKPAVIPEVQNNTMYFNELPDRAMGFYLRMIPGLQPGYDMNKGSAAGRYMSAEDIVNVAKMLGAKAIIRGYVQEYSVKKFVDADLRTFLPPFLGLWIPEHRGMVEVAYYLYDGETGQLVWNSTVETSRVAQWPLFQSDADMMNGNESGAAWGVTGRITPNWQDLMMNHPRWISYEHMNGMGMGMGMGRGMGMGMDNCPMQGERMQNGQPMFGQGMEGEDNEQSPEMGMGMGMGMMPPGMHQGHPGMGNDWMNPSDFKWQRESGRFEPGSSYISPAEDNEYGYHGVYRHYTGLRRQYGE